MVVALLSRRPRLPPVQGLPQLPQRCLPGAAAGGAGGLEPRRCVLTSWALGGNPHRTGLFCRSALRSAAHLAAAHHPSVQCRPPPTLSLLSLFSLPGVNILSIYRFGGGRMGLESPHWALPSLGWLGARSSQLQQADAGAFQVGGWMCGWEGGSVACGEAAGCDSWLRGAI